MNPFAPGLFKRLPEPPRKVVVVRAMRIGDYVCATPALRALRAALPTAEITFIGLGFTRDLVGRLPYLDRFVEFPGFPGLAEQFFEPRRALEFFADRQAEHYDLAIQMNGSGVYANPFTLMLGARVTAGWIRPGDPPGRLDAALPFPEGGHEVEHVLGLVDFLGAPRQGNETEFPLLPEDEQTADNLLAGVPRPLIGIHPAAREESKRWAPERFAVTARALAERFGGTPVIVASGEEDGLADIIQTATGQRCLNLTGRTSLPVLGGVLARLSVLVTNDSGPAHIAYALRVPTVTIFGSTDPARWGPPPARQFRVIAGRLENLTVGQVVAEAGKIIEPDRSRPTVDHRPSTGNPAPSGGTKIGGQEDPRSC